MRDRRYDAMRHAVDLARTGHFSNWWCVAARLRIKRYAPGDLAWTALQREWLDRLCLEARTQNGAHLRPRGWARVVAFPARSV